VFWLIQSSCDGVLTCQPQICQVLT
jgi:hypothetical protein